MIMIHYLHTEKDNFEDEFPDDGGDDGRHNTSYDWFQIDKDFDKGVSVIKTDVVPSGRLVWIYIYM